MKSKVLALFVMGALLVGFVSPVHATTYFGPSFQVTSTGPGGTVYLTVSTNSSSTFVAPPEGSGAQCSSGQTCNFPLEACTNASSFYYSIHEITMTDPNGNSYMLGSSATSGMYWPQILGGPAPGFNTLPLSTGYGNQGDALNLTLGDTFVLPFGSGAGGFSFTTSLLSPPQTHAPEGPYYWWTVAGNVYGSDLRLDQNPSINPTTVTGVYVADVEGVVVCGSGVFFDQGIKIFFDSPLQFTTPQFPVSAALVTATGLAALVLIRKRIVTPPKA